MIAIIFNLNCKLMEKWYYTRADQCLLQIARGFFGTTTYEAIATLSTSSKN
ncbi:hypothetical protein ACP6PL_10060 [Dapis sp. BLCC M126]